MSDDELPTEIVARLRQLTPAATGKSYVWGQAMKDAADEIERLRAILDAKLPCDVRVAPATVIRQGCTISTLITSIDQRRKWGLSEYDPSLRLD
jgi:hypothetical protein